MAITPRSALRPSTEAHSTWWSAADAKASRAATSSLPAWAGSGERLGWTRKNRWVTPQPVDGTTGSMRLRPPWSIAGRAPDPTIVPARAVVCRVRRRCVSTFDEKDEIKTIDMTDRVLASGRARAQAGPKGLQAANV